MVGKKWLCLLYSLLLVISLGSISVAENSSSSSYSTDKNTEVVINENAQNIPLDIIESIIQENPNSEITIMTYIKDRGDSPGYEELSEHIISGRYEVTSKNCIDKNIELQNVFVTSVAKGTQHMLSSDWKHTFLAQASHKGAIGQLGISRSATASISKSFEYTGPPESSINNSRTYWVKFIGDKGVYTGHSYNSHGDSRPISGNFIYPRSYVVYWVDCHIS